MKRTLITAALCTLTLLAQAQRLSTSKTTIDVGKTGFCVPVTATFELRNKGLKNLHIKDVRPDCGCTKVDFPRKSISPGERFTISMTYDARMLGHFTKQMAIYSNATKQPVFLKMKGVVLEEVKYYSAAFPHDFGGLLTDINNLEFDDVNKGDQRQIVIKMVNNTEQTVTPNLLHLPPYLTAVSQPAQVAPGRMGQINVTLHSEYINSFGLVQAPVYLAKQLGERVDAAIEMPVSVVLLPDVTLFDGSMKDYAPCMQLSAEQLNLGVVEGKKVKSGVIDIVNTGRSALRISSMQMFTGGMKVTLSKRDIMPGEAAKLKVAADRDELLRQRTKPRVLMITNDPQHTKVIINVNIH
ncbi:MAG: DUF1573 domain-containing protein [Prevotella sp.]|nr:DUF1573 domain-containing protein [Prevotella sp.]